VKHIIGKIEPKTSSGHDNISSKLMIQMSPLIICILRTIINQSITTGIIPDAMKTAKVIPIYKGKDSDPHDFGNYRPISLLPVFSKILEKAIHQQLYQYLHHNSLLNERQYGFRPNHSTEYAAVDLVDNLKKSLDNKKNPFAVFIDLSKAFDTLDHNILISKLHHYGIRGTELTWFRNYLGNRKQYVKFNNVTSPFVGIKTGVPQGSVLGPLLFLIYINDISNATKALDELLFADDTNLYNELDKFFNFQRGRHIKPSTPEDIVNLGEAINCKLALVVEWLKINKLSVNITKSRFMIFHTLYQDVSIYNDLVLKMDGIPIKRTKTFNLLGLTLNETVSWNDHTNKIASKVGAAIGVIYRLRQTLPKKALMTIYNALILSHLHYCNILWGNTPGKLLLLQQKALRAVSFSDISTHSNQICKKLGTLTIMDIHRQKIFNIYKLLNANLLPTRIKSLLNHLANRGYDNYSDTTYTSNQMKNIKHEIAHTLNQNPHPEIMTYLDQQDTINVRYATVKARVKEIMIESYPSNCCLLECQTCRIIIEDISMPTKSAKERRRDKRKNRKKNEKKKCRPNCTCIECQALRIKNKIGVFTAPQTILIAPRPYERPCPRECYCPLCSDRTRATLAHERHVDLTPSTLALNPRPYDGPCPTECYCEICYNVTNTRLILQRQRAARRTRNAWLYT
jgi:hypothetical protein